MGKWIAFDEESTAAAAVQSGMAVGFQRGDALDTALASSGAATVLLPAGVQGEVLVVEVRRLSRGSRCTLPSTDEPIGYEASGFLGLSDEPVYAPEPVAQKKWWKRLLD